MRALLLASLLFCACSSSSNEATPAADASTDSGPTFCNFNDECPADQRCDCQRNVEFGCTCTPGPRGSGKSGVDACSTGFDCISGLCVEGASGNVCSGRCTDGCGDKLPRCANISGLGEICVREPPPTTTTGATGTFGAKKYDFSAAFFGYDYGDSGPVATTFELHAGYEGGCPPPTKDPAATIVIAGVPLPFVETQYETGIKATLLGFDPALPIKSSATSAKFGIKSIEKCPAGVCALEIGVTLVFAEGNVSGPVRAIHCDSLDVR